MQQHTTLCVRPLPAGKAARALMSLVHLLGVLVLPTSQQQPQVAGLTFNTSGFACSGCLAAGADGTPVRIRAMFFAKPGVVQNDAAERLARLEGLPYDCASRVWAVPQCFRAQNWDKGWVGELFFDIVQETGGVVVAMTAVNFSSSTAHAAADELTRCAWEVQLGLVDVCVADVWETDARRMVSTFTSPIDVDIFKLVTKSADTTFKTEQLLDFAKPFELNVWLVAMGTLVLGGLLVWVVDDSARYTVWIDTSRRGKALAALRWPARRLVLLGYIAFALLLSASYIAWLAQQYMSATAPELRPVLVSSIADAIASGRPLCMLRSSVGLIQQPGMKVEAVDSVWRALENIQANRCVGAVITHDDYLTYVAAQTATYDRCPAGQVDLCLDTVNLGECLCQDPGQDPQECPLDCPDYHRFCDVIDVPDANFNAAITMGLPVTTWLHDILSAWIVKKRLSGQVDQLRRLYIEDANPPICGMGNARKGAVPMTLSSMAGVFVVSGALMLLGFLWHQILECIYPTRDPADVISAAGGNYRLDPRKRAILAAGGGVSARTGATGGNASEFRQEAQSLVDNIRTTLEETTSRNEERVIRQEERIVRQDRKLDELRAVVDDLNGKLCTEMAEETLNYSTHLSAAVARLKVSEEQHLDVQREVTALQLDKKREVASSLVSITERESDITQLQLQLHAMTAECVGLKQVVGERVGELFDAKQRLTERDGEIQQLKEARINSTEELMQARGQLGEKTGQVQELRQQSEESRADFEKVQSRLHESLAEIMRMKMQLDLEGELHAERELELSKSVGTNAGEALELRLQNRERSSELQRLREGAGERAGEMFELRQALHEHAEEIIELKGQVGERGWELLDIKQQLGHRAAEVLAANEKLQQAQKELDEKVQQAHRELDESVRQNQLELIDNVLKAQQELDACRVECHEWKWQAGELRREQEAIEHKLQALTTENARMFGDNAALRLENKTLEQVAARHDDDKSQLSEQHANERAEISGKIRTEISEMSELKERKETEICELKLLVGLHAAEVLEARTLLQDRCREIVALEAKMKDKEDEMASKMKDKEELIGNLKTETIMRAMEAEELRLLLSQQQQQMAVLWDLGGKVQVLMEMDLGSKMQHMTEILEKVDCVLDFKDLSSSDAASPRHPHEAANGHTAHPSKHTHPYSTSHTHHTAAHTRDHPQHAPLTPHTPLTPHALQRYEASNTYAPGTMTGEREASLPVVCCIVLQ